MINARLHRECLGRLKEADESAHAAERGTDLSGSYGTTNHENGHAREITWALRAKEAPEYIKADWPGSDRIVELLASGSSDGKPLKTRHLFITSLRTTPEALLRLIRERWSIENWHWIRDTKLHEDKHLYLGFGAGVLATMRTAALNLRRLAGFDSIR